MCHYDETNETIIAKYLSVIFLYNSYFWSLSEVGTYHELGYTYKHPL